MTDLKIRHRQRIKAAIERRRLLWVYLMNHPHGLFWREIVDALRLSSHTVSNDLTFLRTNVGAVSEPGGLWFAIAPKWQQEMFGFEDKKHEKKESK